jgi:Flp pilus assembly protein TadG
MRGSLRQQKRRGTIAVLTAVMLVVLLGMVAFSVDVGYLVLARSELQRSSDAAALAATWELIDEEELTTGGNAAASEANARFAASQFAGLNSVLRQAAAVPDENIVVGYLANFTDPTAVIDTSGLYTSNVVQVKVSRTTAQNGQVPFFMASLLGVDSAAAEAVSTAAMLTDFKGFRAPSDGGNLGILPFALDVDTWNDLLNDIGADDWTWNAETGEVESGPDGILEVNLFPQGTGSPGNRGTVDVGSNNNSTADIARQILDGVTPDDLAHHGGSLELNQNGELLLNGDAGISAGVKDELLAIRGEPRIVPVFREVNGPGNNSQYAIIEFIGIRIVDVKLTGQMSSKRVVIQPAQIVSDGGIPGDGTDTSHFIYSPAFIIR